MGVYINPGSGKFERAIRSEIYIDKTELISKTNKVLGTEQCYVCVSRPRRFGKSMTANMLVAYYEKDIDTSNIFNDYKIASDLSYQKHLNQYDVIALNIQNFLSVTSDVREMIDLIQDELMDELKETFPDIIPNRIKVLSMALDKIYAKTKKRFVFIIDEWDCIFRERKNDEEQQKQYLDFIRNLLKDKDYVSLAYMTGILPIKKYGTHSALNMFYEYSMTEPDSFEEYVGFTEPEIRLLCDKYQKDFNEMKSWYDGYSFVNTPHIYNPKSVVESITRNKYGNYWTRTETYEALKVYIEMNFDGLKDAVISMLAGGRIHIDIGMFQNDMTTFKTRDDVMTLLVHLGYLAYDQTNSEVYIPNMEIREEFRLAIEGAKWDDVIHMVKQSENLLKSTWAMDEKTVENMIDTVHMDNTSILTYNDENSLSCVISLAYYNASNYYNKVREFPTGLGFADIVFIPKKNVDKPAMIVELKNSQSAKGAIQQIKDKKYIAGLSEYKGNVLLVGINYDKSTKKHQCVIEKVEKE